LTLEQIKELRIVNADGEITDLQVPTLGQVLEVIDGEVELLLEIKRKGLDNKGIEEAVLDVLKQYDAFSYTTIQSFNDSVLEKLYSLDPTLKLEKLVIAKLIGLPVIFDGSLTYFSTEKYHYVRSFNFFYRALSSSLSNYLHKEGYKIRIWTINDPGSLPDIKLDGIITDHPELF
jgi:glycerophosphoryl diester phosphodiesterase